jgi:FkbH-like protein
MVHQAKEIGEYTLRCNAINALVEIGGYDNIVQDSATFKDSNVVLILWEIYNFIDGLQYKIEFLSQTELAELVNKIKIEIDIVFNNLDSTSLVIINRFSSLIFNQYELSDNKMDFVVRELNAYLENKKQTNFKIIDIDKVISKISIADSIDLRYYYSSKTLYSIDFYKEYFKYLKPLMLENNGKAKKALIFDCDNTLWKGILGEDGFENIKMFQEVQYLAKLLAKNGVIIGLCSKNNPEDVDDILKNHAEMILKDEDIVIKKVNWKSKSSNLLAIAEELNIGLDSLVFIDDSDFEINLIREKLPMVRVLQVPKKEYEYNLLIRNAMNFFYNPSQTKEDLEKVKMYKDQKQRIVQNTNIEDIEGYLESLELVITTYIDDINGVKRASQITQKTNQFNLTTKRYTENDIEIYIQDSRYTTLAIGVNDKFGDSGVVGLAILEYKGGVAHMDSLFMSCRVLGRNIEYKFMDIIVNAIKERGVGELKAQFIKTFKNEQVATFYDRCGFEILEKNNESTTYKLLVKNYKDKNLNYIRVKNGK